MTFRLKRILVIVVVGTTFALVHHFVLLEWWIRGPLYFVFLVVVVWCLTELDDETDSCRNCGCARPTSSPSLTGGPAIPLMPDLNWQCPECGKYQSYGE